MYLFANVEKFRSMLPLILETMQYYMHPTFMERLQLVINIDNSSIICGIRNIESYNIKIFIHYAFVINLFCNKLY